MLIGNIVSPLQTRTRLRQGEMMAEEEVWLAVWATSSKGLASSVFLPLTGPQMMLLLVLFDPWKGNRVTHVCYKVRKVWGENWDGKSKLESESEGAKRKTLQICSHCSRRRAYVQRSKTSVENMN